MSSKNIVAILTASSLFLSGCEWGYKMPTGSERFAAVSPERVEILFVAPNHPFRQIGIVSAMGLAEHVSLCGADGEDANNYEKKMLAERSKTRGKPSDRYPLFVSWSDEDQVFIGYCPALFVGGVCHDENRIAAYAKLVEIVEEDIQSRLEKGEILPEPKNDLWFAEGAPT